MCQQCLKCLVFYFCEFLWTVKVSYIDWGTESVELPHLKSRKYHIVPLYNLHGLFFFLRRIFFKSSECIFSPE